VAHTLGQHLAALGCLAVTVAAGASCATLAGTPPDRAIAPSARLELVRARHLAPIETMLHEAEARSGASHPELIDILERVAAAYVRHGAYLAAAAPVERALRIAQTAHGEGSIEVAAVLSTLAQVRLAQGDYAGAEPPARRAVAIARSLAGEDNAAYALLANSLGAVLVAAGKPEGVEEMLVAALGTIHKLFGPPSYRSTLVLETLAQLQLRTGRVHRAEGGLLYALTVRSESGDPLLTGKGYYDPDPRLMGPLQSMLGALYTSVGYPDRARPLLHEALTGYEGALDELHPLLERVLVHLAALHDSVGEPREAGKYRARAERIHAANRGYAYIDTHPLPPPLGAPATPPRTDGLFATARVGDWVVYHSGDTPSEKHEVVSANPRAVVVRRHFWHHPERKFSEGPEQTVERWIDLKDYFGLGPGALQPATVTFRGQSVRCLTFTDKSTDATVGRYYFAPEVIPVGGLLRLDVNDEPFLLVADYGRAR
jgi:tetratricopeptide (TPR) repeat protein